MNRHDYSLIPQNMLDAINGYVDHGWEPGSFLGSVFCNDFVKTCFKADDYNVKILPVYASYVFNRLPANCWGSVEIYEAWLKYKQKNYDEK